MQGRARASPWFRANVLGVISPKIKITIVAKPTEIATASSAKYREAIEVVNAATKLFTKLLPTKIVVKM